MCTESHKDTIVEFLYGELPVDQSRAFETHLKTCEPCRAEVAALRAVRDDLLAWAPAECRELPSSWSEAPPPVPAPMDRLRAWMPAFGLAAAAMLLLAVSAAIANVEIRYDAEGLVVRTGRGRATTAVAPPANALAVQTAGVTPGDLAELEHRMRQTFAAAATRSGMQTVALSSDNPQLSREVRRLIEESERRTRQEMAQRFLDIVSDVEGHRRTDMLRVTQAMTQEQRRTSAQFAQQNDIINRLMLAAQGQQTR